MNLPDDIEMIVRFLGEDDPAVRRLVRIFRRHQRMQNTVRTLLRRRCVKLGFDPADPPIFWPVRKLPDGVFHIGCAMQGEKRGPELRLSASMCTRHTGIFGFTGAGKSVLSFYVAKQAIETGHPIWIFDLEDEYVRLLNGTSCGKVAIVQPKHLRFSLFEPPGDWVAPTAWLDVISDNHFYRSTAIGITGLF